jgi:hypothetical protein
MKSQRLGPFWGFNPGGLAKEMGLLTNPRAIVVAQSGRNLDLHHSQFISVTFSKKGSTLIPFISGELSGKVGMAVLQRLYKN